MGVFIRGMEMPKSCGECDYCHPKDKFPCWCYLVDIPIKPSETDLRDGLCPLIEVTKPHGDLIDRDAIPIYRYDFENGDLVHRIDDVPVVIEAEGER